MFVACLMTFATTFFLVDFFDLSVFGCCVLCCLFELFFVPPII